MNVLFMRDEPTGDDCALKDERGIEPLQVTPVIGTLNGCLRECRSHQRTVHIGSVPPFVGSDILGEVRRGFVGVSKCIPGGGTAMETEATTWHRVIVEQEMNTPSKPR